MALAAGGYNDPLTWPKSLSGAVPGFVPASGLGQLWLIEARGLVRGPKKHPMMILGQPPPAAASISSSKHRTV